MKRIVFFSALVALGLVAGFLAGRAETQAPHDSQWYVDRAGEISENFHIAYDVKNIPRDEIAQALVYYLKALELNPTNTVAYRGAIWCYQLLGADVEADKLRAEAKDAATRM